MKPKAITIFDLDGTLLNEKSEITKEVASAMSELKKIMFFLLLPQEELILKLKP